MCISEMEEQMMLLVGLGTHMLKLRLPAVASVILAAVDGKNNREELQCVILLEGIGEAITHATIEPDSMAALQCVRCPRFE